MDKEKAVKLGLSLPPSQAEAAKSKADSEFGGNFSRYIQSLIERDLAGGAGRVANEEANAEVILEHLTLKWRPDVAQAVSASMPDGLDQKRMLGVMLAALPAYFEADRTCSIAAKEVKSLTPETREAYESLFPSSSEGYIPEQVRIIPALMADIVRAHIEIQAEDFIAEFEAKDPAMAWRMVGAFTSFFKTQGGSAMKQLLRGYASMISNRRSARAEKKKRTSGGKPNERTGIGSIFNFGKIAGGDISK